MKAKLVTGLVVLTALTTTIAAAEKVHKEFTVGERPYLILKIEPAHLIVETGPKGKIVVDVELPSGNVYTISTEHDADKVLVKLNPRGTLGLLVYNLKLYEIDVRVKVPEDCDVLFVTRSGQIEVSGVGEVRSRSGSRFAEVIGWVLRIADITRSNGSN